MRLPVRVAGPLALLLAAGAAASSAQQQQPPLAGGGLVDAAARAITRIEATAPRTTEAAPQPLGYENEVSCFGYIGPIDEQFVAAVIGAENVAEQIDFTDHNLLYLDGGYDRGIKPGDEFWIVTPGDVVVHPITGAAMGRFYQYRGRAVVLCVEGRTAIVRVTLACTDIPMGIVPEDVRADSDSARPPAAVRGHLRSGDRQGPRAHRVDRATASSRSGRAPTS